MKLKLYLLVGLFLIHFSMLGTPSKMNEDRFANYLNVLTVPAAPVAKTPQIYAGTATLAGLTATGTNLKWYAAPTGGIPLALTTALVNESTYYVSQTSAGNESSRTAVKANKISEAAQTFCNGAAIASLVTTPTAIPEITTHWFTSATGGTALEGTTTLTPGDYYVEQRLPELYTVVSNLGEIVQMTADALGNLYFFILETGTITLKKTNPDGTNVQTLASGLPNYYFTGDVAVDASGTIYIAQGNQVKKMNNDGTNSQVINNTLNDIIALAIDAAGILYISTGGSIVKMNSQGSIIGTFPNQEGEIIFDLDVDSSGNIYSTTLSVFDSPGGIYKRNNNGSFIQTFASDLKPFYVTVDPNGSVYFITAISQPPTVKKMNTDGTNIQTIPSLPSASLIEYAFNGLYLNENNSGTIKKLTEPYTSNRVKVTVSPLVAKPNVVSPVNYLQDDTALPLTATTAATSLVWYTTATSGTASTTAPTPITATEGTTSYWVASVNESGCESPRTEIVVSVGTPATHLHFDGVNDHINIGTVVASGSSYTKEAMIQANALSGGYNIVSSSGDVFWIYQNQLAAGHSTNFLYVSASATELLNTWNHVAVTYDAPTSTMKLYINGNLVSENNAVPAASGNALQIGAYASAALFNGSIDEVRIWNRALSAEELNRRKNCELNGTEQGLLAYFNFNQGLDGISNTGLTTLTNAVSEGNNGTLNNFALASSTSNWTLGSPIVSGISIPSVPTVTTPIQLGQGSTATALTATSGGTGLMWYTTATGGTGNVTAPTPTTSALGNTSYWVASTNANGCESARTEIVFTVTEAPAVAAPTAPVAKTPQIYAGTATVADLTATGTDLQWYATATGGTALPLTSALIDNTTYYVSQSLESIESFRTAVKANKISEATQTVCNGATIASLVTTPTAIPEVTTHWFTSTTSETALAGTTTLTPGDYYVEQRLPELLYTVASNVWNVTKMTADAEGNLYLFIVQGGMLGATITIKRTNPDGTNVQTLASGLPHNFFPGDIAVDASGTIYIGQGYEVKKMNNDGTNIQVINNTLGMISALAIDAAGILYIATGGSIVKMNSQGSIIGTFPSQQGEYIYDLDVDSSGNIYSTSLLGFGSAGIYKRNNNGSFIQTFASDLNPLYIAVAPSGLVYFIDENSGNHTVKKMNTDGTNIQTIPSLPAASIIEYAFNGLYLYEDSYVNIKKLTTPYTTNRVKVTIVLEEVVTPPVTTPVTLMQDATAAALTATSGGTGLLWYTSEIGGTASTTAPTPDTTTPGSTSYWVSSTNANGCESARTEIVVTVLEGLAGPVVQTPQIYAGTATIADLTATGTDLQWYATTTGIETLELNTALVNGTTYYVSQTIEGVESLRIAVQVKKISEATQTVCSGATVANLISTPSENGAVEWFATTTDAIALDETAALASGSYYVEQTVLENTSNRVLVTVVVDAVVSAPSVTTPISYAQGAVASALTATSGSVGLVWYPVATEGTGSATALIPSTATVGNTSYWVASVNANGCESTRSEIVVSITQDVLTIGSHPSDANITGGQSTSFTATVNSNSANYQWQVSHDGGSTFTDLTNDGIYSGVTSAALTLTNVPISMHGKQYKVKVSNGSEVLSNAATLNVSVPNFNYNRFWKNKGMAGFSAGVAADSFLALDANNTPYVAFRDDSNGEKTSVMKFDGTSWVLVGAAGFSDYNYVYSFSMAFDASNMPYVAYLNANNSIEVKYFNGTSWTNVGASGLESEAEGLSLKMDPSGIPFVAYTDYSANYKTSVRKLVGNSWTLVGNAGFSAGESYDTSFAIDPQGTPYVVYRDDSNEGKATAMKFNGTAWESVGPSSGFSPSVAFYTSLSIDRAGTPYATFVDYYADEPVVMKFNGSEWVMVGTPGFASGVLYSSSIVLDGSGTPFLVYQDFVNSNKVTVKRFDGTSWTTVGESGFSMGAGNFTAIDLDSSGTPHVVFIDAALGNKVTVMKFNGSNVETIWENGSWDNGEPSFTMKAIIDDTLMLSTDLQASALEVTTNGSITVATGTVLTVGGKIINNNTPAHFVVEDHGILLQQQDVANEGDITVNVNSFPLYRQDYTLWSSPVENQNLRSFSLQTLFNRFSSYDTAAGTGANPVGAYVQEIFTTADMAAKTFTTANGYLIRMPNNWDDYVDNSIPGVSYPGVFKGVPQNGTISRALSTSNVGLNLVGNPYPSPISIDAFFDGNPGVEQTIYYWRKRNDASGSGYATFNALGFVSAQSEINNLDMEYVINPGQGFFVKTTGATQLNFNNTMRSSNTGGLFLRNAQEEKHRVWLRLSNSTGSVGQTLIGYTAGATENVDNGLDAAYFNDSSTALTSLINGDEYAIQGRSLPFSTTDSVPLGFKSALDGDYTLSLSNFDGVFATEQAVFLKDNTTGSVTNLKLSDYSFTTPAGVFNSRFELRYDSTLNTDNPKDLENQILIASKNNTITINAGTAIMEKIELYDVSGRLLFEKSGIDKSIETLENLTAANQVLLVKVITQDKVSVTKKIVY